MQPALRMLDSLSTWTSKFDVRKYMLPLEL